jgi:Ca2+-binding RTX toxin-like protein
VTGPNGYSVAAQLLAVNQATDGVARTATYRITAPGWSFDGADNGLYTVASVADEVTDTAGNALPAKALGTFAVNLPTVFLSPGGLLSVAGTGGKDSIALAITASRTRSFVQVNVNGTVQYFAYRSVGRVQVQGLAGNDTINVARNLIGTSIDAGDGHDVVYGTNGSDYIIGGAGDDIIYAYAGKDFITAGPGYDRVFRDGRATIEGVEKLLRAAP